MIISAQLAGSGTPAGARNAADRVDFDDNPAHKASNVLRLKPEVLQRLTGERRLHPDEVGTVTTLIGTGEGDAAQVGEGDIVDAAEQPDEVEAPLAEHVFGKIEVEAGNCDRCQSDEIQFLRVAGIDKAGEKIGSG